MEIARYRNIKYTTKENNIGINPLIKRERKSSQDNLCWLVWHQSNGGTSCHKFCTFASLTFLTWYVSYDSLLKRCLKDTFLILLCSNNSQVFASWKNLRWNLNKLNICPIFEPTNQLYRCLALIIINIIMALPQLPPVTCTVLPGFPASLP